MTEATYKFSPIRAAPAASTSHVSLVFSWGDALHAVALREGQSLVVGRSEPAQLVLDDRSLSRTHARLSLQAGRVSLKDLESTNGVTINGHAIREGIVGEGDLVRLGSVELRVIGAAPAQLPSSQWRSLSDWTAAVDAELARARLLGRAFAVLAVRSPDATLTTLPLRPVDLVCEFTPQLALVLLPEARTAELTQWVDSLRRGDAQPRALGAALAPEHGASAEALIAAVVSAARRAKFGGGLELAEVRHERPNLATPVVASPCMARLYELVARVARTNLPVLVLGETGSGKELVAQAVHQKSPREKGPFKALNCATIPANLIESVLFGHERGAFTGADKQAPGIFEQAHGGTVFLDEVGELSERAQAALLRVLETKRVVRVGATKELEVDVRVVAATHRDLASMVREAKFRQDLMFRLDALSLRVPPLRERREEIAPLARLFLERARVEWGALASGFSQDALDVLEVYAWPGNVRQLRNTIERAAAVCAANEVDVLDLDDRLLLEAPAADTGEPPETRGTRAPEAFRALPDRVREFEVGLIREALGRAQGNQAQAARILGVPRRTLAHKVHAFGLIV
jgi:two-component system response regulator AtoC